MSPRSIGIAPIGRRLIGPLALVLALIAAQPAAGQSLTLDFGDAGGSSTARIIQLVALMTVLSLVPSLLIMLTSFTRIVIVLSFLRSALGTQQSPPNVVLISLALFLTGFIMTPTLEEAYRDGVAPLIEERISEAQALERTMRPFHRFMMRYVRDQDLRLFLDMSKAKPEEVGDQTPLRALIPAFLISELRRAFEMGFLIYLPFLIIDMVVASVLMAMGMMMLPPATISLPFKLIFFVLVDGWYLVAGSLVQSFGGTG